MFKFELIKSGIAENSGVLIIYQVMSFQYQRLIIVNKCFETYNRKNTRGKQRLKHVKHIADMKHMLYDVQNMRKKY